MKKFVNYLIVFILLVFSTQCKSAEILRVGAGSTPHAEILEYIKPILAQYNINLQIVIFQDYIMPNKALYKKALDANYYQHIAFFNSQNQNFNSSLVILGKIHIEPIGLYSKTFKSLSDIPVGTKVIMSNSLVDRARFLAILDEAGLIKLRSFKNLNEKANADIQDIKINIKRLKFITNIQPSLMPTVYLHEKNSLVFINTNYALTANINPLTHSLLLDSGDENLYANVLVARKDNASNPKLKILLEILQSQYVKNFILEKYNGLILPLN